MLKIKIVLSALISSIFGLVFVAPALAVSIVSIQTLPSYETTNNFKISCTTDGTTAQFSVSKNGGSFTAFGPAINVTTNPGGCVVQVGSSVVNDQTNYSFKVNVDGTDSVTTTTFYDISGPSPVSNYSKQRVDDGTYKLQWTNPGDSDFDKAVIYRGDTPGFSADANHEIARVSGGSNANMSYDDHFSPDSSKTYYYAIRALDHAGNSSSLAGDAGSTTTTTSTASPKPAGNSTNGTVTQIPVEKGTGSVLAAQASPTPTSSALVEQTTPQAGLGLFGWISTHKKISLGIAAALLALGYGIYYFTKRK